MKLFVLSDAGSTISTGLSTCVFLVTMKVTPCNDVGGLRCDASGLHPQ
jgi:hypothetical protein